MTDFLKILGGLVLVMISNVILGINIATLKQEFSKDKLLKGIVKSLLVVIAISFMYLCTYLNPDVLVANINGTNVGLIEGMRLLFIAGIIFYGYQDLTKLATILKIKVDINEKQQEESVTIPKENEIKVER